MKVGTSVRAVALLLLPLALLAGCSADVSTIEVAATPDVDPSVHAIKVNATDKILGGRAAGQGEFPAVVELSGMTSVSGYLYHRARPTTRATCLKLSPYRMP